MYQHPRQAFPSSPHPHYEEEEPRRRTPARSHSHRSIQSHRILEPRDSLPRRSKSFRDPEVMEERVLHERQLSTVTFVPPSPYQVKGECFPDILNDRYMCMYMYMYVCMYVCMYMYMYVCM